MHGLHETVRDSLINDLLLVGDGVGKEAIGLPKFDLHRVFDNAAEIGEG